MRESGRHSIWTAFRAVFALGLLCLGGLMAAPAMAECHGGVVIQASGDWLYDPGMNCNDGPGEPVFVGKWYTAIVKSKTSAAWGASWHMASEKAAEAEARRHCNARDCSLVMAGLNDCIALALASNGAWATSMSDDGQQDAIEQSMRSCRKYGGDDCDVVTVPCARNMPSTPPCMHTYPSVIKPGTPAWNAMDPATREAFEHAPQHGVCKS